MNFHLFVAKAIFCFCAFQVMQPRKHENLSEFFLTKVHKYLNKQKSTFWKLAILAILYSRAI